MAFTIFTIFSFSWRNASFTPRNVTTRDRKWQLHLLSPLLCRRVHFVSVSVITDYDLPPFNPPDVNSQFLCGRSAQQEEVPGACPTVFPRLQGRTQFLYRLIIDFRHRPSSECSNLIASHFLIIPLDQWTEKRELWNEARYSVSRFRTQEFGILCLSSNPSPHGNYLCF